MNKEILNKYNYIKERSNNDKYYYEAGRVIKMKSDLENMDKQMMYVWVIFIFVNIITGLSFVEASLVIAFGASAFISYSSNQKTSDFEHEVNMTYNKIKNGKRE